MTRDERRNSGSEWARTWKNRYNDASSAWPLIDALDECLEKLETVALHWEQGAECDTPKAMRELVAKIKENFPA